MHSTYFTQFTPLLADYYLETLYAENGDDPVALEQRLHEEKTSLQVLQMELQEMKQSGILDEREKLKLQRYYDQEQIYFLIFEDNNLVGMARLLPRDSTVCQLHTMFVHPSHQGKHLGSKLLDRVIKVAIDGGYSFINLTTRSFMKAAIGLYLSRGFAIVDYLDFSHYHAGYDKQQNIVYMQKKL